jgi:hypothetical protein
VSNELVFALSFRLWFNLNSYPYLFFIVSGFTAGKCLEEAALMAVAMKQPEEAAQLYEEAATRFGASGSHEKAAEVLTEAAK